jgi:transposase-like protein
MRTNRLLAADLTRRHWNKKTAARVLAAWRESGMPLSRFARANGLGMERLRRWGKRIEGGEDARTAGVAPMTFIPAAVLGAARAVVRLPGGVELEGDAAALPADWVAALARALVKA